MFVHLYADRALVPFGTSEQADLSEKKSMLDSQKLCLMY